MMKTPVTKTYLDALRARLIAAEDADDVSKIVLLRDEYRQACAAAYSCGCLVFKDTDD